MYILFQSQHESCAYGYIFFFLFILSFFIAFFFSHNTTLLSCQPRHPQCSGSRHHSVSLPHGLYKPHRRPLGIPPMRFRPNLESSRPVYCFILRECSRPLLRRHFRLGHPSRHFHLQARRTLYRLLPRRASISHPSETLCA